MRQEGTILFAFLRWPLSLWPREQALRSQMNEVRAKLLVNSDQGQDLFSGVKTRLRWPCDSTSGNLNKTSVKRKVQRCLSGSRLSFSELFDDFSLMLNVRRLCVVVDCLISAVKVCDCVIFAWCWQVCDRVVELRFRQNILCQPLILFRRCLA